jgi:hypothetical protein
MAICNSVENIAPSECIGDSLVKINNNFSNLNTDVCTVYNLVNGAAIYKNRIINAQGVVNQRGYASGTPTTIANQYTLDRWRVVVTGQSLSFSTANSVTIFTAPAGGLEQVIEGLNIVSGNYVLSWTQNSGTTIATVNGTPVLNGGTVTLLGGTDTTIRFTGGTFSLPQFEKNATVTFFEYRPIGTELALCQRYYFREASTIQPGYPFATSNTSSKNFPVYFPVTMRSIPTVTVTAIVNENGFLPAWGPTYTGNGAVAATVIIVPGSLTTNSVNFYWSNSSYGGWGAITSYIADAEL